MLANDPDEAARQAEDFLREKSLSAYYDEVAMGGLALAQLDVNRGVLEHERRVRIKDAVLEVIDDLSDHNSTLSPLKDLDEISHGRIVICVAGRGSLDEAAAAMLGQLLERQGVAARVVPSEAVAMESIHRLDMTDVEIVCLSYLDPGGFTSARYLVRRLRRKLPSVPIIVGFWTLSEEDAKHRDAARETGADRVVTSLWRAVEQLTMTESTAPHGHTIARRESEVPPAA
jgi:CheY-like chemotaxis protein